MKKFVKELFIAALLVFIFSNIISWMRQPTLTSTQLPEGTVKLLDGSSYAFKKGKPVVIHFWATWCRVCRLEASNIDHVSKEYDVLTVAVNSGNDREVKAYMQKRGVHFRVLNDTTGEWARHFNVEVFPTTFIYDGEGELKFTEVGYTTTAGLMARLKLLE